MKVFQGQFYIYFTDLKYAPGILVQFFDRKNENSSKYTEQFSSTIVPNTNEHVSNQSLTTKDWI